MKQIILFMSEIDSKKRIIVATHQLPWIAKFEDAKVTFTTKHGHSARHAGARALKKNTQLITVGWMPNEFKELEHELWIQKNSAVIFLDPTIATGHYEGYCKTELWPLFHYVVWGLQFLQ
jgi:trehalose-6-phosphate synthase